MKYCSQCNKQFDTPGNFCPQCGNRLGEITNTTFCPNCGKKLEVETKFCDSCGIRIDDKQTGSINVSMEKTNTTKQYRKKYIYGVVAVLIAALIGGVGYFLLNRQDNSASESLYTDSSGGEYRNRVIDILPAPLVNLLGIKKQEIETEKKTVASNGNLSQEAPTSAQTGNGITVAPAVPPPAPPPPFPPYNNGNVAGNQNNNGAYIRGTDVRIRTGPGLTYDIMGHFNNGERVTILEVQEGWYKVRRADNSIGFVSSQFCIRN